MNKIGSMATLLTVALVALGLMTFVSLDSSTGLFTAPKIPPKFKPGAAIKPPIIRPTVVDRDITVVDQPEYIQTYDDQVYRAICYDINLHLDIRAGGNTPPDQISSVCPSFV
ncbi:MAG TPA: hypothetical protein VI612_03550 [Candidatus Nanoarchaeia archaeon]|nr:hypothetical protein [Candidatus Nanoarchaeia archaeon]